MGHSCIAADGLSMPVCTLAVKHLVLDLAAGEGMAGVDGMPDHASIARRICILRTRQVSDGQQLPVWQQLHYVQAAHVRAFWARVAAGSSCLNPAADARVVADADAIGFAAADPSLGTRHLAKRPRLQA